MRSRVFCFTLLSTIAISVAVSLPAQAQRARVFVSVNGNDSNPCTALSPCRTFQAAHDAVQPGGEVDVLDTGGYGTLTITKSISIVNPGGVVASIAPVPGQSAITVNAQPNDTIALRGLTLDGTGLGSFGITFNSGGNMDVADCVVRRYSTNGILFAPNSTSSLNVTNSQFNGNGNAGIQISPSASVVGALDHVGLYNNGAEGFALFTDNAPGGTINFTVKDSVASGGSFGFVSSTIGAVNAATRLILVRSVASNHSDTGILSQGSGAQVIVDESTIFNNAHAWVAQNGGFIFSHGNNSVEDNAADDGPVTPAAALK
jgi:hypothetical protein